MAQAGDRGERQSGEPRQPSGGRPSHLITRAEARAWLAGSAVRQITTHRTDEVSALSIRDSGVDIEMSQEDIAWGRGFYSTTRPDPHYGMTLVHVAVRLMRPLELPDTITAAEVMDDLSARIGGGEFRDAVIAAGYDGVVLHVNPDETWVIAYHSEQVKVIVEETRRG